MPIASSELAKTLWLRPTAVRSAFCPTVCKSRSHAEWKAILGWAVKNGDLHWNKDEDVVQVS